MIQVYSPEQLDEIASSDFMCRIASSQAHPELVEVYDYWALLVQPDEKRLEMGIAAAGLLVARPFTNGDLLHATTSKDLPDAAIVEAERVKKDAARKLIRHAGFSVANYRGVIIADLSEGPFAIKNAETGRSVEHMHKHVLPKMPGDVLGGVVTAFSALHTSDRKNLIY